MKRPSTNIFNQYGTNQNQGLLDFSDTLQSENVKVLVSLDDSMHGKPVLMNNLRQELARNNIILVSDPQYFINDFFSMGWSGKVVSSQYKPPGADQIKRTVDLINHYKQLYPNSLIAVHCGAGDGRSGMIKSAVAMEDLYKKPRSVYQNDRKSSRFKVRTQYEQRPPEFQPAYRLVQDGIAEIRKSHGGAVERSEDVEALNEYAALLRTGP